MGVLSILIAVIPGLVLCVVIAWALALLVTRYWIRPPVEDRIMLLNALVIALGGEMVFWVPGLVLGPVLRGLLWDVPGYLLGGALFWVVAAAMIDRLYDIPFRDSRAYVAAIVLPSLVLWYFSGYAIALVMRLF